ncbi:MAG: hypothetical protein EOM46_21885, partial [Gammaproteobacteria bacterium]|nr:hypothetical protein [Gammaproteobacteria bacterium]
MTLLPLVFLLNGLSVPVPELDPADLSESLQQAQQIAVSNPEHCIQLTEPMQQLQDNPLLPGRNNRSSSSERLRDRMLLRNDRRFTGLSIVPMLSLSASLISLVTDSATLFFSTVLIAASRILIMFSITCSCLRSWPPRRCCLPFTRKPLPVFMV